MDNVFFPCVLPLRAAAVSFVAKQKKPKVGLETKVSKNFLPQALWLLPFNTGAVVTGLNGSFVFARPLRRRKVRSSPFPLIAKTSFTPLLLLSPQNPLRWAFAGAPVCRFRTANLPNYTPGQAHADGRYLFYRRRKSGEHPKGTLSALWASGAGGRSRSSQTGAPTKASPLLGIRGARKLV